MSKDKRVEMRNGQLFLITDLDGEAFLRHGSQEKAEKVSLNDLASEPALFRHAEQLIVRREWARQNPRR